MWVLKLHHVSKRWSWWIWLLTAMTFYDMLVLLGSYIYGLLIPVMKSIIQSSYGGCRSVSDQMIIFCIMNDRYRPLWCFGERFEQYLIFQSMCLQSISWLWFSMHKYLNSCVIMIRPMFSIISELCKNAFSCIYSNQIWRMWMYDIKCPYPAKDYPKMCY